MFARGECGHEWQGAVSVRAPGNRVMFSQAACGSMYADEPESCFLMACASEQGLGIDRAHVGIRVLVNRGRAFTRRTRECACWGIRAVLSQHTHRSVCALVSRAVLVHGTHGSVCVGKQGQLFHNTQVGVGVHW